MSVTSENDHFETPKFKGTQETLRRMSDTHHQLEYEQEKLHQALSENQYDHRVFH